MVLLQVSTKTKLEKSLQGLHLVIELMYSSTIGWGKTGSILIGTETITFEE